MSNKSDNIFAGTQVVALVEVRGPSDSLVHPRGAVGVVTRTPAVEGEHYLEISAQARLCFWKAVVQSELDLQKLVNYADMHSAGMLQRDDAIPFIGEYRTSSTLPSRPITTVFRSLIANMRFN